MPCEGHTMPVSWMEERSHIEKVTECARACIFARAHGAPWADPRRLRRAWLNSRVNLLPFRFDFGYGPVLDIGANAGDWAADLLALVPRLTLIAFEPSPGLA